jgi:hypothetical protein
MEVSLCGLLDYDDVLSSTWDSTVLERRAASMFMVVGASIFLQNYGTKLPGYMMLCAHKAYVS